jgi:hypothetical protein
LKSSSSTKEVYQVIFNFWPNDTKKPSGNEEHSAWFSKDLKDFTPKSTLLEF